MSRYRKPRYVIVTETDSGRRAAFGPWLDDEKADELADKIRDTSPHYADIEIVAGDDYIVSVDVLAIEQWPGIRAFRRES